MRYEKGRLCSINLLLIQSPQTKRPHSGPSVSAKKLRSTQKDTKRGKKKGLNKKVSSAVFRAWTDKQKTFYVCAKCNLTLQTTSVHWNILPPCSAQRTQNIDPPICDLRADAFGCIKCLTETLQSCQLCQMAFKKSDSSKFTLPWHQAARCSISSDPDKRLNQNRTRRNKNS